MNPIDAYLMEMKNESATTRAMLAAVPESKYDWRPHEKGMSMAELCGHIASIPEVMPQVMSAESFDITERPGPDAPPKSRDALLARFDAAVESATEWLGGLGDSAGGTWRVMRGDVELMAMPRIATVRGFLLNHTYHHRGQLSAYLRASGEAVPAVYGPTADVDPFAA